MHRHRCAALALLVLAACRAQTSSLAPEPSPFTALPQIGSLVVTGDLRLAPGRHLRAGRGEEPLLLLEGLSNVTVDLEGVELWAAERLPEPEAARGSAILLRDCSGVVVRGGTLRGFRQPIAVERSRDCSIEGVRIEGFHGRRLWSSSAAADPVDRLELEVEDPARWRALYAAAVWVEDSSRIALRSIRARGGQNGLVLARSDGCTVESCDFSFLSGWGVALWSSSRCAVVGNRLDFCARAFVEGRYAEPFGAAGLFVHGPGAGNLLAHNSATHCGTGAQALGGSAKLASAASEPDLWYANDLSLAIGRSFEERGARASAVIANRMRASRGGGIAIQGSTGSVLNANRIEQVVGAGIALLDAREAWVGANQIEGCDRGIELLGSESGAAGASRGHWLVENRLDDNVQDLVLERSSEVVALRNTFSTSTPRVHLSGLVGVGAPGLDERAVWEWLRASDGSIASGRAWGSSLRRRPAEPHPAEAALARFEPPAPPAAGLPEREPCESGLGCIVMGAFGPWDFESGGPPPKVSAHGGLLAELQWDATWFRWDEASDPRADLDLWRALRFQPLERARTRGWSDPFGEPERRERVGEEHFGLIASARLVLERSGRYVLDVVSDDGVRVLLDGAVVLEDWTWHAEQRARVELELEGGEHELRLEYFQVEGPSVLVVALHPSAAP